MVPIDKLQSMLAALASVQTRFGVAGDADAVAKSLARLPYPVLESQEQLLALLPCIVLREGDRWGLRVVSGGAQNFLRPFGSIQITFADVSNFPKDLQAGHCDFGNWIGNTFVDLAAQAGVSDQLNIEGVRRIEGITVSSKEAQGANGGKPWFMASFYVDWNSN